MVGWCRDFLFSSPLACGFLLILPFWWDVFFEGGAPYVAQVVGGLGVLSQGAGSLCVWIFHGDLIR